MQMTRTICGTQLRRSILGWWIGEIGGRAFYATRDGRRWELNMRQGAGRAWLPHPTRFATLTAAVEEAVGQRRVTPCDWCGETGWLVTDAFHWGPCPECLEKGKCPRCGSDMGKDTCTVCDYDRQEARDEELLALEMDPYDYPDGFVRRGGKLERRATTWS